MQDNLSPRSRQILEAIIEDYIVTAEPIGSRTISRRHDLAISPATVRNVMADLEELGYLASPHTSAGRVPTDKAYRLYVDSLLDIRRVARGEREEIRKHCRLTGRDMGEVFKETSRMLSSLSRHMGIVLAPRFTSNVFRQMEFVKLGGRRILAILVSESGLVQNRIIETDEDIAAEDLVRMANYLNELLAGLSISRVKQKLLDEMKSAKASYDELMARALQLSRDTFVDDDSEVFMEGQATFLDQPEFADIAKMKEIFHAFEERHQLVGLLDRCLEAPGVHVFIGTESRLSPMSGLSLITSTYMSGKNTLGVLGVIGPTRMGYAKVIPIVDYTAKLVSRILEMK
jgi:heat-inducible transcriptional repressor